MGVSTARDPAVEDAKRFEDVAVAEANAEVDDVVESVSPLPEGILRIEVGYWSALGEAVEVTIPSEA